MVYRIRWKLKNFDVMGTLIWEKWGTTYFVENNRTIIQPGDTRRTTSELPDVGAKLEAWRIKMFYTFHFLKSDMGFEITNSLFWIFDPVYSEKNCPTSVVFFLIYIEFRTVVFFLPADSWLVNSNFRRGSRAQGICLIENNWRTCSSLYQLPCIFVKD